MKYTIELTRDQYVIVLSAMVNVGEALALDGSAPDAVDRLFSEAAEALIAPFLSDE